MAKVLIAYNDAATEDMRNFFVNCADSIKNECVQLGIEYDLLTPPDLTEANLMLIMESAQFCYVAAHGDAGSVYNEIGDKLVATMLATTNYNLSGKAFFAISCNCAKELKDDLIRIGLKLFVGYNDKYTEYEGYDEFVESANSGAKIFLAGCNVAQMKKHMLDTYDRCIDYLEGKSAMAVDALLNNRESLVIEGDDDLTIKDLL